MDRTAILGRVPTHTLHGEGKYDDDECMVEVIAQAVSGSARTVVRCLYTREVFRVHPSAVY